MGVRAKRWQLWLITMFILTGIIGVFQLFEGPKSVGAVTVAGGVANPSVGLPDRSMEATQLPAWQPSTDPSQSSETRTTGITQKPVMASTSGAVTQTTHAVQVTVAQQATTPVASTKAPGIGAMSASSAKPTVTTTQPKATTATTTTPKPATTTAKATATTAKATTTAPKPSQSVLKPTASATPTRTATEPRCYRFFIFWVCR